VSCSGRARLNGVGWSAVSSHDTVIKAGSVVKINDIKGTKLYVSLYIEEKSSVK
ncbi:MAG: NfeD family protein, partial [Oscillospiraceae bacterium]|nr:NfeD family protein [Oscillospiraceae bacterium]